MKVTGVSMIVRALGIIVKRLLKRIEESYIRNYLNYNVTDILAN